MTDHFIRSRFIVLFLAALAFSAYVPAAGAGDDFEVKTYLDRDSSGWDDKASDYAFLVERGDCCVKWNAVEEKTGKRWLEARTTCEVPFAELAPVHRAILRRIADRWPLRDFVFISWGSFCHTADWSWCVPIAAASLTDREFIEHCRKYRRTEEVSTNHIFIRLANQTQAYQALSDILKEFGVSIRLKTVQKVFSLRFKEIPFRHELKTPRGNPRVMFDVGEAYFYIDR